ncbi:MAG: type II toxin-antitoxin system PemK/MazF family toxin [Pseudobutyrivibrio sp.]|uniref:type II toxin-antitoxin system PemK/MazF family toxin n=1 Tax=Pseudobutyrivibrio sp. TaxID=2014367 RepID=UPI0025FE89E7|nr:type II toxin-antitoxin system PemK/MazF family toxin [Pseudobutyrivibrio sp.]MBQ8488462.1 type II toxin-antitoxin system PemK/MazF family toxin [Pseudobutyrivibrio sp.]
MVNQGDIIKVDGIKLNMLVISRDIINENEVCIVVPLSSNFSESVTHIKNSFSKELLITEQLRYIDLTTRYYKKVGNLSLEEMQNVVDVVQGLFDII